MTKATHRCWTREQRIPDGALPAAAWRMQALSACGGDGNADRVCAGK